MTPRHDFLKKKETPAKDTTRRDFLAGCGTLVGGLLLIRCTPAGAVAGGEDVPSGLTPWTRRSASAAARACARAGGKTKCPKGSTARGSSAMKSAAITRCAWISPATKRTPSTRTPRKATNP
ncbi:MAG: hypothetical protein M5R36_07605 [Deltaproteobacteria bacterium]|nr:hypothetical protein [Deltaproteobacteria bacterium]